MPAISAAEYNALAAASRSLLAWSDSVQGVVSMCASSRGAHALETVKTLVAYGYLELQDVLVWRITSAGRRRLQLSDQRRLNASRMRELNAEMARAADAGRI